MVLKREANRVDIAWGAANLHSPGHRRGARHRGHGVRVRAVRRAVRRHRRPDQREGLPDRCAAASCSCRRCRAGREERRARGSRADRRARSAPRPAAAQRRADRRRGRVALGTGGDSGTGLAGHGPAGAAASRPRAVRGALQSRSSLCSSPSRSKRPPQTRRS